ncbi:uncharacterized protein LOC116167898 [Photinus pyralis]|uniref:BHLH domain-containing protein n=2 Tax=Photinus pyralis TaxID=7054 RepID=A0A1Y1N0A1_PHOPY|nr:uncharacterized protein LOC116167898 [Photinus pyralis]
MTPRREPKKCREWEKIRRDKLNNAFSVLSKLLPNHDPALTWSKVDILHRATEYIEELQVKLKNVLTTEGVNKTKRCEVKMLYGRVKKLLLRNEQLCKLLKDASITIPSGYGVKNFKDPRRWANRITQEEAKEFQKEELQKENKERTVKKKKKTTTVANKHQRKVNRKAKLAPKKPPVIRLQLSNIIPLANPQPLPKVSNRPCFIITNKPTLNLPLGLQQNGKAKASTVVTNSNSLTTPKVASVIKPPLSTTTLPKVSSQTLNKLGPGTLILANGNIVPILPPSAVLPSPTILTNPTPIILKPPPANTTLIVMPPATSATSATKSVAINNNVTIHPRIRPKPITCTTQSNKVPIPAIPRFKETITEKVITKKKEVENKTNKKTKRKVANNQFPNKKSKPAPVNKPQADENKENKVENPAVSANESEIVEKEPPVNKENAPEEVPGVNEEKMDTVEQSEIVAPVIEDKTTEEVQDSIPKEKDPPVEAPAKSQEQDKINTPPPTTTSELAVNLNHSELSNDIFSTLQVPIGGQNPESTSPTAAFLLAFPLVSSLTGVKVTEVIEEENSDSRHGTPTLLQIGTMETTKTTQSVNAESLTPNLLNLDNFSFFSANNFYPSFDNGSVVDSAKISSACAKVTDVSSTAKVASTTSTSLPVYSTEPAIVSKPTMSVVSNSFTQQTPAVSYSKPSLPPPLVTSSYLQNSVPTNNCTSTQRKPADMQYNPVSIAQCNAFNPFSDFSKPNSYPSFSKSYSDPLYTNSNYGYGHHNETNFNQNVYYPPKSSKPNNAYNATNYSEISYNSSDSRKRHMPYYHQNKTQPKPNTKSTKTNPKPPINWMTTPDFRSQPPSGDYLVPPIDYNPNTFYTSSSTHTTYFNTTSSMYPSTEFQNSIGDNRKAFDSSLPILPTNSSQRNEFEENQFPWSPTKLPQFLETPHTFVSSTLPTLVGDLALGTAQTQFNEQKGEQPKTKESTRRSKVNSVTYDNQSNFLSVSQLVENKTEASSSRTTTRRNSGNRNVKSNSQKKTAKPVENKELLDVGSLSMDKKQNVNYGMSNIEHSWMNDCTKPNRHPHKNPQSSYSAEALIGHQDHTDTSLPKQRYRQQAPYPTTNKALPIPTFLSDNIVPYFPPVEIPQDNNFMQSNTNYQSFNTSVQNNSYVSSGPTITSSYLQPSSLMPEFQNFPSMISDEKIDSKHCNRNDPVKQASVANRAEIGQVNADCASTTNNFIKKSKSKQPNESNLPGIVDFGFLSMPNTINSPILPDDFHTHSNFLPPPTPSQLYPCKNPLYGKQSSELLPLPPVPVTRSSTQNFDVPAGVTANAGSSLTSFNLSAIFPEINKGSMPLPGLYPDPAKNKNYNFQRNYIGSSVQVFKSTSSTSYVNSLSTSYAPSN